MGAFKEIVRCLATCGIKSKCKLKICTCCVSDCMVQEKPYYPNGESSSMSSIESNKIKNKQIINRLRTSII